jgi:hypothetical protein
MYRLEKARSIEMGMFANGHRDYVDEMQSGHPEADTVLAASRTFLEEANAFKLLSGYESQIMRELEKHQAQLKPSRPSARPPTKGRRASHAIRRPPLRDDSLFREDEIDRGRERAAHLRAALIYRSEGKLPNRARKPDGNTPLRAA